MPKISRLRILQFGGASLKRPLYILTLIDKKTCTEIDICHYPRFRFPSMNRTISRRAGRAFLPVSLALITALFPFPLASRVSAEGPFRAPQKEKEEFSEVPAKKFIENLPVAAKLPPVKDRSTKMPSFRTVAAPGVPAWTALGPFPIPNGQTETRVDPVSGRVTAIAVHPTNPLIAYVGAAQGGLYRTLDGGATWTPLMDTINAGVIGTPLAIGAVAIDPTNPSNVLVGTGEGNLSIDSFFGNGLYIITNADTLNPVVNGPYSLRASDNADILTGRSIVSIAIDPANHNNVFLATSSGVGGIVASSYSTLPPRGLYRSTNLFAGVDAIGTPLFTALSVSASETNAIMTSLVVDPSNGNNLVCALFSQSGTDTTGGVYRTTNALALVPTFTRTLPLTDFINVKLALARVGNVVTVYATTAEDNGNGEGQLYKSTNGGATFGSALAAADGFAGAQGFYDIAVAVDPANGSKVYIGGNTTPNLFQYSIDGGATFTSSGTGLHADVHAIAVAPSNSSVIYHGNDGGIWKSTDAGLNWVPLNNSTFSATQFQGLALNPSDRNFSLGGTQDNGTQLYLQNQIFTRADFGDGGYSLIDQNATDTTNVTMYHTYYNQSFNFIGTARVLSVPCATEGNWSFHGGFSGAPFGPYCDGSFDTLNGISASDDVNFYAPQAFGPGNPNTWYFGTDKLYRSTDRADTAAAVSQLLESGGAPTSAIAVAAQDDAVRMVGLSDGRVFATTRGSTALLQIAGVGATSGPVNTPATGVGRIAIDPNNRAVAYVCFNGFGTQGTPIAHVWKTTNLDAINAVCGQVSFTPVSVGLPDIPVNAIAIDPVTLSGSASTDIYVGTDAGVYFSHDGGTSWSVYGSGFPHVAVFGLEIQNKFRIVRAATHGRGLYEASTVSNVAPTPTPTPSPSAANPPYGEIVTPPPCLPLTSSKVTFAWSANQATAFWLTVGTTGPGSSDIFSSSQTGATFEIVSNIPTDGRPIYVRLWSYVGGIWFNPPQDYVYNAQAASVLAPVISPPTGIYKKKVTVNMASATSGATLYYTLDGSMPTVGSPTTFTFVKPFRLTKTTSVRAIATKGGIPDSPVTVAGYTITKK